MKEVNVNEDQATYSMSQVDMLFEGAERLYEEALDDLREGRLRIKGFSNLDLTFQGVDVPGGARFEVAENLREDIDVIVGRPEIDAWDIVFTPEGPRPRKVPIEFEIV